MSQDSSSRYHKKNKEKIQKMSHERFENLTEGKKKKARICS